jgi:hypothetical protein
MRVEEDTYFAGTLRAGEFVLSSGCVEDANVATGAAIDVDKVNHKHRETYRQSGTAAAVTIPIHVVYGATAVLKYLRAGTIAPCDGNATITIDIKKNGTTCLASVITLDSTNTARVAEAGTLTVTAGVDGDWFELVIAVDAGTGTLGTGLCVDCEFDETPL